MRTQLSLLNEGEQTYIHKKTLELLSTVGVYVGSDEIKNLLARKGAKVIGDNVRFPSEMVTEMLSLAISSFPLGARDESNILSLPAGSHPFTTPAGYVPFIQDEGSDKKRYVTEADLQKLCILSDAATEMDCFWPLMFPHEFEGEFQEFKALDISFRNLTKHVQCSSASGKLAEWQVELAAAITGGKENLRKNPIMSLLSAPTTPLAIEKGIAEAMAVSARHGIPIIPMSLPQMTTTSPATVAADTLLVNSEVLSCYMVAKCVDEDARFFYSSDAGAPDLRNGGIDYENSEYLLLGAADVDMARFYGLPCEVGGTVEFKDFSTLAGFERNVYKLAMKLMTRPDVCCWFGTRESCLSSSLVDVVLDLEVYHYAKAYLREFGLDEETIALDVIREIGPRGNFLDHDHTFRHFRKEIFMEKAANSFLFASEKDYRVLANEKLDHILANHKVKAIPDDVLAAMDEIARKAGQDLQG